MNILYSLVPLTFLPFFTSSVFIMPSLQCRGSNKARKVTRKEPFRRTTVWEALHSKVSIKRHIQLLYVHLKATTPELTMCFITFVIASKLFNVAETEFMVISSRQKLQSLNDYKMNIHIDGVPINQSNQSKSLGLIIDENLSWKAHILWYRCS